MNNIINKFIIFRILTSIKYLDNNFDEYPKAKKKINDETEAPAPNKILSFNSKFLEKFPKKNTVSE